MNTHRLTDDEVAAALSGRTQVRSSEAATVARAVTDIRSAFLVTSAPPPSAALAAHLDLDYLAQTTARPNVPQWHTAASPTTVAADGVPSTRPLHRARIRRLVGWVSGLGLAWQVGLGSSAAFAAVTGAGVSGMLPDPVQDLFDKVITQVTPFDRVAADIEESSLVRRDATATDEEQPTDAPALEPVAGVKESDGQGNDRQRNAVESDEGSLDGARNPVEGPEGTPQRHPSPDPNQRPAAGDADEDRLSDSHDAEEEAADRAEDAAGDAEDAAEEEADEAEDAAGDAEDAVDQAADEAQDDDA